MTAEENLRLLQEMDDNRRFMLAAYRDNPALLAQAEPRVRAWLDQDYKQDDTQGFAGSPQLAE